MYCSEQNRNRSEANTLYTVLCARRRPNIVCVLVESCALERVSKASLMWCEIKSQTKSFSPKHALPLKHNDAPLLICIAVRLFTVCVLVCLYYSGSGRLRQSNPTKFQLYLYRCWCIFFFSLCRRSSFCEMLLFSVGKINKFHLADQNTEILATTHQHI